MLPYDVLALTYRSSFTTETVRVFRLLRILKLTRLWRLQSLIVNFEMDYNIDYNNLSLCKFIVGTLYLTHLIACGFNLVAELEDSPHNWLTENGYDGSPDASKYTVALYYAAAMVSTIGLGPMVGVTPAEQV